MKEPATFILNHIFYLQGFPFKLNSAHVGNLSAHFRIKWSLFKNEKTILILINQIDTNCLEFGKVGKFISAKNVASSESESSLTKISVDLCASRPVAFGHSFPPQIQNDQQLIPVLSPLILLDRAEIRRCHII